MHHPLPAHLRLALLACAFIATGAAAPLAMLPDSDWAPAPWASLGPAGDGTSRLDTSTSQPGRDDVTVFARRRSHAAEQWEENQLRLGLATPWDIDAAKPSVKLIPALTFLKIGF
jgi:hypothetical protein